MTRPSFVINNMSFTASDLCDGEGTLEFRMQDGNVKIEARGEIQVTIREPGVEKVSSA